MKRTIYTTWAVAVLLMSSFAFAGAHGNGKGKGNDKSDGHGRGACVSACARAAAEYRQACAKTYSTSEEVKACMAEVQTDFKNCKSNCSGDSEE
jgi:hypothetical protein